MLKIYQNSTVIQTYNETQDKISHLDEIGILYLQVPYESGIIEKIKADYDVPYTDIITVNEETINYEILRDRFNREHFHSDYEMRYFTEGTAKFFIHVDDFVFELTVEPSDLISVPANVKHWFDAGDNPSFTAIRFFNDTAGWVAQYVND